MCTHFSLSLLSIKFISRALNRKMLLNTFFLTFLLTSIQFFRSIADISINPENGAPMATLSNGIVEGQLMQTELGTKGYVFLGVPYVEPPLGKLRFAKPIPKKPWSGILLAKQYKAACPQNATISPQDLLNEDCLYANIFVGTECTQKNLCPVIYYIHGGGYEFDSVRMFPPEATVDNFASKGLVYVTLGYRLGFLGFFSTGTEEFIGNWAMEDMVEGARWIQREIHNFGGDRTKVTAVGHSSSAMALSLLTMSPKTEGLFDQAIIMSGSSVRYGSFNNDLTDYHNLAVEVGCATDSDWYHENRYEEIVDCLREIPAMDLVNAFNDLRCCDDTETSTTQQIGSFIVKETMNLELPKRITLPRNDGPNGLFPKPLDQLIAERRPIKTMTGTTKNENGSLKNGFLNATGYTLSVICEMISKSGDFNAPMQISRACKEQYILKANPSDYPNSSFPFWAEQISELFQEIQYFAPCYEEATTLRDNGATVYLYSVDYEKAGLEGIAPWHSMDLTYLNGIHPFEFDQRDYEFQKLYVPLFINFAKYGNPTPPGMYPVEWTPLKRPDGYNYLSVNIPPVMKPDYHKKAVIFWNDDVPKIEEQKWIYVRDNLMVNTTSKGMSGRSDGWRVGFWIVFSLLCISVVILISLCACFRRFKRRMIREAIAEERALLGSLKYADSYDSVKFSK